MYKYPNGKKDGKVMRVGCCRIGSNGGRVNAISGR